MSAFWPLDDISKPKTIRNQLLQSLSERRNEVMQSEEAMWWAGMVETEVREMQNVNIPGDPQKVVYSKMHPFWLLMTIAVVATVLWTTSLLYTSGFEKSGPKDTMILLWIRKSGKLLFLGNSLRTCGMYVYMAYPPRKLTHWRAGTRQSWYRVTLLRQWAH